MKPRELTGDQRACLDLSRNLAVVAGAGSGKTRVLVARYLAMLDRANVDNILAVTFTKKAAAEMLERTQREVQALRAGKDSAKWETVAEELGRAHISTIHSFCERLLREFPIEAGVDPAFQVVEDVDRQLLITESVERMLFDIAQNPSDPDFEALSRLVDVYSRRELTVAMEKLLNKRHDAGDFMTKAARLPSVEFWALLVEKNLRAQKDTLEHLLADKRLLSLLTSLARRTPARPGDSAQKVLVEIAPHVRQLTSAASLENALSPACALVDAFRTARGEPISMTRFGSAKSWPDGVLEELRSEAGACAISLSAYGGSLTGPLGEADKMAAPLLQDMGHLFLRGLEELDHAKGSGRRLDFDDLIQRARELLARAPTEVRDTLRSRYRYVMIDEFQDTDPSQWEIMQLLIGRNGVLPSDAICVLGDPKQSIYGFRDADVRVIQRVREQFTDKRDPKSSEAYRLSGNFRSLRMLVDFQNFLFARLMADPRKEFEVDYVPMTCERSSSDDPPGRIEILSVETAALPKQDNACAAEEDGPATEENFIAAEREAELVALKIREVTSNPDHRIWAERGFDGRDLKAYVRAEPGHIALLLRGRTNLPLFEDALRRHSVPYSVHAGIGYFQRQEILDIRNILTFLANESEDVALVGALRSPLFGLSDGALFLICCDRKGSLWERLRSFEPGGAFPENEAALVRTAQQLLPRWQAIAGRFGSSELLLTILDDTAFMGSLGGDIEGRQARANVDKLVGIIRTFEEGSAAEGIGLQGLVARLEKLCSGHDREGLAQLELEKSNAVKIMTTHAAKGLEFPIVFLPDLARGFRLGRSAAPGVPDIAVVDRELGVALRVPDPRGTGKQPMHLAEVMDRVQKEEDLAEEKRLLYVAVTRARDELYLVGRNTAQAAEKKREPQSHWEWIVDVLGIGAPHLGKGAVEFPEPGKSTWRIPITTRVDQIHVTPSPPPPVPLFAPGVLEKSAVEPSTALPRILSELRFVEEPRLYPEFPATALNQYDRCRAAFYLHHIIGIPEDAVSRLTPEALSSEAVAARAEAILLGTLTHAVIEEMIGRRAFDESALQEWLDKFAQAQEAPASERLLEKAMGFAQTFAATPIYAEAVAADEVNAELPFVLKLRAGVIRGKMDLIFRKGASWRIVDYKTSRIDGAAGRETLWREYLSQMQCYAVAAAKLFPESMKRLRVSLYATRIGEEIGETFDAAKIREAEAILDDKVRNIVELAPARFIAPKSEACSSCGYCRAGLCRPGRALWLDAQQRSTVRPL